MALLKDDKTEKFCFPVTSEVYYLKHELIIKTIILCENFAKELLHSYIVFITDYKIMIICHYFVFMNIHYNNFTIL